MSLFSRINPLSLREQAEGLNDSQIAKRQEKLKSWIERGRPHELPLGILPTLFLGAALFAFCSAAPWLGGALLFGTGFSAMGFYCRAYTLTKRWKEESSVLNLELDRRTVLAAEQQQQNSLRLREALHKEFDAVLHGGSSTAIAVKSPLKLKQPAATV